MSAVEQLDDISLAELLEQAASRLREKSAAKIKPKRPSSPTMPTGESDEVAAARARRVLDRAGLVRRQQQ